MNYMTSRKIFWWISAFSLFAWISLGSCSGKRNRLEVDITQVRIPEVVIHRYDLDLFKVDIRDMQSGLERLRPDYRFFLETDLSDPKNLSEMKSYLLNPRNIEFHTAVTRKYRDVGILESELTDAFRHYRYYFPGSRIPRVYAYISGGTCNLPVQMADSVMLIGLDNYLGKEFKPYIADGLPAYRVERMNADRVVPDCMRALINSVRPGQLPGNNLLEQMIEAGKGIYFLEALIPDHPAHLIIGYTEKQEAWIEKNEAYVWAAIIDNRLLFSTDGAIIRAFISDGPFTAEFSKESPPRLGEWIGWQIVRKFMTNNPDETLRELLSENDFQKILNGSGYKPEKP